jgi:predicted glycoside hydrolase/deacetylase ChbG (UPF0249 family)
MKLLCIGDDFAFTRAVTFGIVDAIDYGILRNTGIFINSEWAEMAIDLIKERSHVCLGIDFNLVAGKPISDPKDIPHLVDEKGYFHKSTYYVNQEQYNTEEGRKELFPYDEVRIEIRAQYNKFLKLVGKEPGYLNMHSIIPETYDQAIEEIHQETNIPRYEQIVEKYKIKELYDFVGISYSEKKEFDVKWQLEKNMIPEVFKHSEEMLSEEYVHIICHPGYVDAQLVENTTLSIERMRDAQFYMSPDIKKWVDDNNVELITFYDLVD